MTAWARIESDDLREFIGNLRRAGCPEETIRDVVTFRVGAQVLRTFARNESRRDGGVAGSGASGSGANKSLGARPACTAGGDGP